MTDLQKTTPTTQQNKSLRECSATLAESIEGQKALSVLILESFQALNLYGKKADSLKSTTIAFKRALANYHPDDIANAWTIWLKRSDKFPTPANIVGLIERGGKPPLSEAMYVTISKKHPEDRTAHDWNYMQEFEYYMTHGEDMENSTSKLIKQVKSLQETKVALLNKQKELYEEMEVLKEKVRFLEENRQTDTESKTSRTVNWMRENNYSDEDIRLFLNGG